MNTKAAAILLLVFILTAGCNLPGKIPTDSTSPDEVTLPEAGPSLIAAAQDLLEAPARAIVPPPIVPIPKSTETIYGVVYTTYQSPGDVFRIVCHEPCGMDEPLIYAIYAGFKVFKEKLVRVAGVDIVPEAVPLDIHPVTDSVCYRPGGEMGSSGTYEPISYSIFICLYIDQVGDSDPYNPPTPETAIRAGGLGVIGHEYSHSILYFRHRGSLEGYVDALSYAANADVLGSEYLDMCSQAVQDISPLVYQFCIQNGLTLEDFRNSLIDLDRLYRGGYGLPIDTGMPDGRHVTFYPTTFNQHRAVLQYILGSDPWQAFVDGGMDYSTDYYETTTPYVLPYADEPCTYRANLQEDVTIPEGTMLDVGTPFDKTWRIANTGTCAWEGVRLAFASGENMAGASMVDVPATAAGGTVDVSVPMTASLEPGVHVSQWHLQTSAGELFGPVINMILYTRPGCSQPPEFSDFSVSPATIAPGALAQVTWSQVTNADQVSITPGIGVVDANYGSLLVSVSETTTFTMTAACAGNIVEQQVTLVVDESLPPFEITDLLVTASPENYSGPCADTGQEIVVSAEMTASGPGAVIYRWSFASGGELAPRVFIFENAGTRSIGSVEKRWSTFSETQGFAILGPVTLQAEKTYSQTCTP